MSEPQTRKKRGLSLISSVHGGARLLERMGFVERLDLHAFLVDAHAGRHAGDVALEVADGTDDLAREADIGDGRRIAMAEAAGLLFARDMRFDAFERLQRPVREPLVARGLVELQFLLHVGADARYHERMA